MSDPLVVEMIIAAINEVTSLGKILCFLYQDMAEFEVAFLLHRLKLWE